MTRRVVRLVAEGRVQRVGYRAFVEQAALSHGLVGFVRNRADGSVEAVVAGEAAAVEALATLMRRGPSAARVSHLAVRDVEEAALAEGGPDATTGFVVAPTL